MGGGEGGGRGTRRALTVGTPSWIKFWMYAKVAAMMRKGARNHTLIDELYCFSRRGDIHPCLTAKSIA